MVGVLVTDTPLEVEDGETILAGTCPGLGEILESTSRGECPYQFGTAGDVLLALNDIVPAKGGK